MYFLWNWFKVGCGIRHAPADHKFAAFVGAGGGGNVPEFTSSKVVVFFTKNGKEIGSQVVPLPPGGFFPAVSLQVWYQNEKSLAPLCQCIPKIWKSLVDYGSLVKGSSLKNLFNLKVV